jgi:hypothetical protein
MPGGIFGHHDWGPILTSYTDKHSTRDRTTPIMNYSIPNVTSAKTAKPQLRYFISL